MVREQKQTRVLNLSEPAVLGVDEETKEDVTTEESNKIPPKNLLKIGVMDLKKLKGYREIRIKKKKESMMNELVVNLNAVLDMFDNKERKYDYEIIQFIYQCAEDYFSLYSGHEDLEVMKDAVVYECASRFFNDDVELMSKMLDLVRDKIVKTSVYRRMKTRLLNFFSSAQCM